MARWAHATAFGPWSPIQPSMRSTRSGREIRLVAPSTEVRMPKTASTRCSARTVRAISNRAARAVVAGLSMGGYVAMSILERYPDLVAGLGLVERGRDAVPH